MMKRFLKILPVAALLFSVPAFADTYSYGSSTTTTTSSSSSDSYSWYPFSKDAQGVYFGLQGGGSWPTNSSDLDNSGSYAISLGWQFHPMIRAELEAGYRRNGVSDFVGHENTYTYMANLFWDFKNSSRFTPYVGGGLGWAENELRDAGYQDDDSAFVYQLGAGVSYNINDRWAVTADYRWVDTSDFDHGGPVGSNDYRANEVRGGLRYTF